MMLKILAFIISVILTSCYNFPIGIAGGTNTKMLMAVFALIILCKKFLDNRNVTIEKDFIILSIWGIGVSFASVIATTYNNTQDFSYLTYAISMWVWMGGAYALIKIIEWLNGQISVDLVCDCIIAACSMQCVLAFLIDKYPLVENIALMISPGLSGVAKYSEGRLFSIGCAFDIAGIRLSCGLVALAFMVYKHLSKSEISIYRVIWYFFSFAVITVFGNMISRTTMVGCGLFLAYLFIMFLFKTSNKVVNKRLFYSVVLSIVVAVPITMYMYNTDPSFRTYFRFGFEGFFSLAEKGEWDVGSNEILWTMYRFPETLKTWIIGDGYMLSANTDPYYTGPVYLGFYKGTDVGYLRFVYYFGIIGLIPCVMQMIKATQIGMKNLPGYKMLCFMLLMVNFICWFKVSTDTFSVMAIFAVYGMMYHDEQLDKA